MKRARKDTMEFTKLGVTTGVGASVISGAGGDASALSAMSGMYPTAGAIAGSGMALRELKKIKVR